MFFRNEFEQFRANDQISGKLCVRVQYYASHAKRQIPECKRKHDISLITLTFITG